MIFIIEAKLIGGVLDFYMRCRSQFWAIMMDLQLSAD